MKRTLIAIVVVAVVAAGAFLIFKGAGRKDQAVTAPAASPSAVDVKVNRLLTEFKDPTPDVRIAAIQAAGDMKDPRLMAPLVDTLGDSDVRIRATAAQALGNYPEAAAPLAAALEKDPAPVVRANIASALGRIPDKQIIRPLVAAAKSTERPVRGAAVDALLRQAELFGKGDIDDLIGYLDSDDVWLKRMAAAQLARIQDAKTVTPLLAALKEKDAVVRKDAARGLGLEKDPTAVKALTRLLTDADWQVKQAAAAALGEIGDPAAVPSLIAALKNRKSIRRSHEDSDRGRQEALARKAVCAALGRLKDPRAASVLADRITRGSGPEKIGAAEALCKIAGAHQGQEKNPAEDILKKTAGNLKIDPAIRAKLGSCLPTG